MSFKEFFNEGIKGSGMLAGKSAAPHKAYMKKLDKIVTKAKAVAKEFDKFYAPDMEYVDMNQWDEEDISAYHSLIRHHLEMVEEETKKIKKIYKDAGIK